MQPRLSAPGNWDTVTQSWYGYDRVNYVEGPSIFTQGQANYVFQDFGAGKWLSTVAADPVIERRIDFK